MGKTITYREKEYTVVSMQDAVDAHCDIAIFSAGGSTSLEWAPKFAAVGTVVIDNSSAWRMDKDKKLVVPEVNAKSLSRKTSLLPTPTARRYNWSLRWHHYTESLVLSGW